MSRDEFYDMHDQIAEEELQRSLAELGERLGVHDYIDEDVRLLRSAIEADLERPRLRRSA